MPESIPNLTEAQVVRMTREYIEGLFPKTCPNCKQTFATYREYLLNTRHIGLPLSYDIECGEWKPSQSDGNLSLANCMCGSTLALSSEGMPPEQIWQVLKWVKTEAERRHVKTEDILGYLRAEVSKQGLA